MQQKIKRGNFIHLLFQIHIILAPYTFLFFTILFGLITSNIYIFSGASSVIMSLILGTIFLTCIPILIAFFITKDDLRDVFKIKKISPYNLLLIFLISLFIQPFMSILSLFGMIFGENLVTSTVLTLTQIPFLLSLIAIAITPAIFEELFMRGVMLKQYEDLPLFKMAVINGMFFGFMHGNIQQFFYASFLGFIFVYFVKLSGSILSSIFAHFIINASQLFIAYISFSSVSYADFVKLESQVYTFSDYLQTILIAIPFTIVVLILMMLFIKNNKENYYLYKNNNKDRNLKVIDRYFLSAIIVSVISMIFL